MDFQALTLSIVREIPSNSILKGIYWQKISPDHYGIPKLKLGKQIIMTTWLVVFVFFEIPKILNLHKLFLITENQVICSKGKICRK